MFHHVTCQAKLANEAALRIQELPTLIEKHFASIMVTVLRTL